MSSLLLVTSEKCLIGYQRIALVVPLPIAVLASYQNKQKKSSPFFSCPALTLFRGAVKANQTESKRVLYAQVARRRQSLVVKMLCFAAKKKKKEREGIVASCTALTALVLQCEVTLARIRKRFQRTGLPLVKVVTCLK